ncbi:MAG: hypothetical protein IT442_09380 [Phycisphaeraceae bacterium]|nr:hypothetical protein [Phycisphaeraceae bacterium]
MIVLGLLVYGLCLMGAWAAGDGSASPAPSPIAAPPVLPLPAEGVSVAAPAVLPLGFALNLHYTDDLPRYLRAVDRIAGLGFDSLLVVTPAFQEHGASEEIVIPPSPGHAPSREQLLHLLTHAKGKGLRTALMPIVLLSSPRGNEWRGKINPEHWDVWWDSYERMQQYFQSIAAEADVDLYAVGSELISTEVQLDRWQKVIGTARSRLRCQLFYSTNWDHYDRPAFWGLLDAIGINGYWNITTLTDTEDPDPALLVERWRQIRQDLEVFARVQGRPILLTEIGYPSLPWALEKPWNYVAPAGQEADGQAQAMGYEAFIAAWSDMLRGRITPQEMAWMKGVFFYEWDVYHAGGPGDTGMGVEGKPVLAVLEQLLTERAGRHDVLSNGQ